NNSIKNTIIKNASVGIISDSIGSATSPTLTVKNTQIYNSSNFGILGRGTNIYGENLVINNSGQNSLACTAGGTYSFIHATFANFWTYSFRQSPSVLINNFSYESNTQIVEKYDLLAAIFTNCIIEGNSNIELMIDKVEGTIFNYTFKNNMIRFYDPGHSYSAIETYNFADTNHYVNTIFNGNPHFKAPYKNQFVVGQNSEGIKKAASEGTHLVPKDILGTTRTIPADIGAYQHIIFN
ncbi:MAG: hypothetical protein WC389_13620, partial [Lutibacter sp.]